MSRFNNVASMQDVLSDEELDRIYTTPSSYLGSCRYKMPDIDEDPSIYEKIFEILNKYEVER